MRIFFGGAESPAHRKSLEQGGVSNVALSFWGLRPRLGKKRPFVIANRFPEEWTVMLDSGGNSANRAEAPMVDPEEYVAQYHAFVEHNLDRLEIVTEFDYLRLGLDAIEAHRRDFWEYVKPERFCAVWHPEHGPRSLEDLCERYDRVAIPDSAFKDVRGLASRLSTLVHRHGVKLHGASVVDPAVLSTARFDTVMTTSWVSPSRFGETQVWDGTQLKRYPASMKSQARKRHRGHIRSAGFDHEAIENDDKDEVSRFTLWSWLQMENAMSSRRITRRKSEHAPDDKQVTGLLEDEDPQIAEGGGEAVDDLFPATRNFGSAAPEPTKRPEEERRTLPVVSMVVPDEREQAEVRSNARSLRKCDNCFVSSNCPAFKPGFECSFDLPVRIETKDQLRAVLTSVIEMQTHRVAFMRYAEEMEGGYADPNLSQEVDRLFKLTEQMKNIEDNSEYMKVAIETRGSAGVLSRIFGDRVGETAAALRNPLESDIVAAEVHEIG